MTTKPQRQLTRAQRSIVVSGMLCFVLILVVLQLWLLTATMNAYSAATMQRSGRHSARLASISACCVTC